MSDDLFDISKPRIRARKEEAIKDLQAYSKTVGGPITGTGYKEWQGKRHSLDTVTRLFGSFRTACEAANVKYKKTAEYSDKELIEHFEKVWRWRGQKLVKSDMFEYNKKHETTIHPDVYSRRWGWTEFIKLFSQYKLDQITFDDVVKNKKLTLREPISPRLRAEILKRDDYRCADCGANPKTQKGLVLEVHHINPVSNGGKNNPENLITNCHACNAGKSDKIIN